MSGLEPVFMAISETDRLVMSTGSCSFRKKMMEQKRYLFGLVQLLSYLCFGVLMAKLIPYLDQLGYDSYARGFALSGCALATIMIQLGFGYLFDKIGKVKRLIIFSMLTFTVTGSLLFALPLNFTGMLLLVTLSGGYLNALCGFIDSWIMGLGDLMKNQLSQLKAFGSLGWTIGSLGSSVLLKLFGYQGIALLILGLGFFICGLMFKLPDSDPPVLDEPIHSHDILTLWRLKSYMLLILTLFLLYAMVVANTSLVVDKMIALKASPVEISLKWAMGSLLEIPMYAFGMVLIKKYGSLRLLQVSAVISTVQFLLFAIASSGMEIVLVSLLQVFTTPIILVTSKLLIDHLVPNHLRNSGQMIAISLFVGGSAFLVPIVSGLFGILLGYSTTLILFACLGLLAFYLLHLLSRLISSK
ncbi:MFS family permease [Streptococcus rupicaprae]|uniref:MFS family permease n=1 Tax=Streptococcus rupicaprae TaxID=759619 RepID=A0ABV2FJE3_9STRE